MVVGILAGLATCALWGLTFVASRTIAPYTTWDLTVARYGLFGLASLLLMLHPRFRPVRLRRGQALTGFLLGLVATPGYFACAAFAVRLAGAAVPPLIIGLAPAVLAVLANRREAALSWRILAGPIVLILVGLATVDLDALRGAGMTHAPSPWLGLALSLVALAMWIAFGSINAAVMRGHDAPDGLTWTGVQGLGAGIGALLLAPLASPSTLETAPTHATALFVVWALLMGLAGSWIATWCWVTASRRLPLAILSQLIVAETVFGLVYGFLYERRWPTAAEWTGAALQLTGVALAIALFSRTARPRVGTLATRVQEATLP